MQSLWRSSLLTGALALALVLLPAAGVPGQDKKKGKDGNSKSVSFKTHDGVTIQGTLYPSSAGKKDAVVMLLHNFDAKKGGNSSQDNWPQLAKALQSAGYSVLAFDFRGFGESKEVNAETFWKFPHNGATGIRRRTVKPPETIDHKDFTSGYYAHLVNDVAAAKAYLDRRNDARELNSGNVVLVGAGQGATLGAMWAYNEGRRRKDKRTATEFAFGGLPNLGEPEAKDIAGSVWLTISPSIGGRNVSSVLDNWLRDAVKSQKIPMGFYYGKKDTAGGGVSERLVKSIRLNSKDLPVATRSIDGTNLSGSKLLDNSTIKQIVKDLDKVVEARGSREMIERNADKSAYYYVTNTKRQILNKKPGEEVPPVDLSILGLSR